MRNNNILNLLNLQGVIREKENFLPNLTEIWIKCPVKEHICPTCHTSTSRVHDYYTRSFNHIMVGHKPTKIYYKQRRYVCLYCGKRFAEKNSFIQKFYRHSNDVVNSVFDDLTSIKNLSQIGQDNNMSSQNVSRLMNKFIPIFHNTTSLPEAIGIDEFRGNSGGNKFQVVITNLKTHKVIDVIYDRSKMLCIISLERFLILRMLNLLLWTYLYSLRKLLLTFFLMLKLLLILFILLDLCIGL